MKLLAIGTDRSIAHPDSRAGERQRAYYDGWDVDIVILAPGHVLNQELGPGLRIHTTGGSNKVHAFLRGFALARKIARERKPEVVTAQDPLWSGIVASRVARYAHAAFHLQDHSGMFARTASTWTERLLRPYAKMLARRARRVRTVSERGKRGLERIGVSPNGIDVIPIPTDPSRFLSLVLTSGLEPHVLCVARLEPEKGVEFLLRSWIQVARERPDARLRIVGDGSLRVSLEQLLRHLGLQTSVEFVGATLDVTPHFAWATMLAVPSVFEGWGLAVIEAACAGRPVVMTDVGAAGEVIRDGESGRVVSVRDPLVFARALLDVMNDPASAQRFAQRAREIAQSLPSVATSVAGIRTSFLHTREQRLLVLAQAVDADDPLFGFFILWLREAAKTFSAVTVLALRVGRFDLPANVSVVPLRPFGSRSKFAVIRTLWSFSWRMRHRYDAVFVRGDAIYVVLGAWLWKTLGKPVIFWYAHYTVTRLCKIAVRFATRVVSSVPEACAYLPAQALYIGQAIDAQRFAPAREAGNGPLRILIGTSRVQRIKGTLDSAKACIEAGATEKGATVTIIGPHLDSEYAKEIEAYMKEYPSVSWGPESVSYDDVPNLLRQFDVMVNAYEASLDKTIVECMMSGIIVVAATAAVRGFLPQDLWWLHAPDQASRIEAMRRIFALSLVERQQIRERLRAVAVAHHSLEAQLERLSRLIKNTC